MHFTPVYTIYCVLLRRFFDGPNRLKGNGLLNKTVEELKAGFLPPFPKGGQGGFYYNLLKIPLKSPFRKGGLKTFRISCYALIDRHIIYATLHIVGT